MKPAPAGATHPRAGPELSSTFTRAMVERREIGPPLASSYHRADLCATTTPAPEQGDTSEAGRLSAERTRTDTDFAAVLGHLQPSPAILSG
ncbi:hypothetical protein ZHAS_00017107 [Anopheles sinensis]|uniref:Uncharacterized protein n=1 Tax=Anopheles sinensis TaxID=74873 RepID=A0A084WF55_ANOSI|nr:hypothetical protein ZHAS_00017107 [Anopheles sinensis]